MSEAHTYKHACSKVSAYDAIIKSEKSAKVANSKMQELQSDCHTAYIRFMPSPFYKSHFPDFFRKQMPQPTNGLLHVVFIIHL